MVPRSHFRKGRPLMSRPGVYESHDALGDAASVRFTRFRRDQGLHGPPHPFGGRLVDCVHDEGEFHNVR